MLQKPKHLKTILFFIIVFPLLWWTIRFPLSLWRLNEENVDILFSHSAWVTCLANPDQHGFRILSVGLKTLLIKDMDGSFSVENMHYLKSPTADRCMNAKIILVSESDRIYEVPFGEIYDIAQFGRQLWVNPFSA